MYSPVHALQFITEKIAFYDARSQEFQSKLAAHKAQKESGLFYRLFRLKWEPGFMDWIDWADVFKRELEDLLPKAEYYVKMNYATIGGLEAYWFKFEERFYKWCQENKIPR